MGKPRSDSVLKTRNKNKIFLVKYFGGKCEECGYNKCLSALTFHHIEPSKKEFTIGPNSTKSLNTLIKEAKKCRLLCRNCHAEEHAKPYHFNFIDIDVSSFDIKEKPKKISKCVMCEELHTNYRFCTPQCSSNYTKKSRTTKDMIRLMKIHKNFTKVGELLNCTANTVKKRMKKECPKEVTKYLYKKRTDFGNCLTCNDKIKIRTEGRKFCSRKCFKIKVEVKYNQNIAKILELLDMGLTVNQISAKLKIHRRTLENYIEKYKM